MMSIRQCDRVIVCRLEKTFIREMCLDSLSLVWGSPSAGLAWLVTYCRKDGDQGC